MPEAAIDQKLSAVLTGFEATLRARLTGYDALPNGVKMALLDMAYNLGPAGLLEGYPRLIQAVETGAWAQAAAECARGGINAARNAWTRRQMMSAVVGTIQAEGGGGGGMAKKGLAWSEAGYCAGDARTAASNANEGLIGYG